MVPRISASQNVPAHNRAFTLIELLLALAILVSIAAVVTPSFSFLLGDRRLARAGDQLRVEMMQTRLLAMRAGRTHFLQMKLLSDEARVRAWIELADMTEAIDQTGTSSALLTGGDANASAMQSGASAQETREIKWPEGIIVQETKVEATQRSYLIDSQAVAEASEWSQPILFYPDGSTSTAAVTFTADPLGKVVVLLRGLTGEVTVTDVLASEGPLP